MKEQQPCGTQTAAMLRRADAVYFLPGWRHSRGARHERYVAEACGIPIRTSPGVVAR